ncbi:MAG: DUF5694 domain-containing protein [Bacteroidota bacterium]
MTRLLFLLLLLGGSTLHYLSAQRPTVAVLGLTHLHNPGQDAINMDVGDIRSPQRQAELREVVELISRFKPTKIAFEFERHDTLWSQYYYEAWLAGRLEDVVAEDDRYLLTSEIVQLAYPVARAAGLQRLHPIDAFTSFPLDSALAFAQEAQLTKELTAFQEMVATGQALADSLAKASVLEILRANNSRYFARNLNQNFYLNHLIGLGKGDDYPGTYVVEQWYARNLRIFTNLHRIVAPQDRVLVLFGAGHKEILDDLIPDRVGWDWLEGGSLLER